MEIQEKITYRLGVYVTAHRDKRTQEITFTKDVRRMVKNLVTLYEALEEVGFDISQDIFEIYLKKLEINKKYSDKEMVQKIEQLVLLNCEEMDLLYRKYAVCGDELCPEETGEMGETKKAEQEEEKSFKALQNLLQDGEDEENFSVKVLQKLLDEEELSVDPRQEKNIQEGFVD